MSSPARHLFHNPRQHDHAHGEDCSHQPIHHDDHVDYLHDGHWRAAHDGHYDDEHVNLDR